ncbi:hypothetical protein A6A06_33930 [Streptomyces sp. CB02923]|uniref:hypothetical protein n=1 Tax=Streptomyces sp. CB02923 TaxID=1718985 RepID=UPI00093A0D5E|nr:hypothetical protein [Streptomyces sp. CB02923]OKI08267.1 hypothetical protein A6A06_33930 [Streptomyces sp. CB02923]
MTEYTGISTGADTPVRGTPSRRRAARQSREPTVGELVGDTAGDHFGEYCDVLGGRRLLRPADGERE